MANWAKFEALVARKLNGKRTPGSGNGGLSGDIRTKVCLIECKETSRAYLSFLWGWLDKLVQEARSSSLYPVFGLEFSDGTHRFLHQTSDPETILVEVKRASSRVRSGDWEKGLVIKRGLYRWKVEDLEGIIAYVRELERTS